MQITELIEKAVQCLEAIGLDPETIYDYRCIGHTTLYVNIVSLSKSPASSYEHNYICFDKASDIPIDGYG